jgi:DNA repair photolyase
VAAARAGHAHPLQRLRAVRELVDAGIHAGVLMNPIVPGITSKPALLERTVKAIADHGAQFVGCNVMFLEGGTRDHFMRWLQTGVSAAGRRLHAAVRPEIRAAAYRKEVSGLIAAFKNKYGLSGQRFSEEEQTPEEQKGPGENLTLPFESVWRCPPKL